jgi:GNAT superfamily N-acetyltransferase
MEPSPEPDRPPEITVRTATIADAEAITDAHVAAWQSAYRGIMPDRYLDDLAKDRASRTASHRIHIALPDDPRSFHLVSEYDGDVVGWLSGGPSRDDGGGAAATGEVWAIYIHPDYWRSGVGSALMTVALQRLADDGYSEAVLWVFEANTRARGFYERFAWRPDGATEIFERGGGQAVEIRYRRPLSPS